MRARWVFLIAGGILAAAIGLLFIRPNPGRVSLQRLGVTNGVQLLLITNGTRDLHFYAAWAESPNKVESLTGVIDELEPRHSMVIGIQVTNTRRRITFAFLRTESHVVELWMNAAVALLGIEHPYLRKVYIDVPE